VLHVIGRHDTGGGVTHVAVPLQVPAGVNVLPTHDDALQIVPAGASAHAPRPSQVPSWPQPPSRWHMPRGSIAPADTVVQNPGRARLAHVRHAPVHALSQHTPSTQKPDAHWLPSVHWPGRGLRHALSSHTRPATQSASLVQRSTQVLVCGEHA
jgi:hypothetical protein